MNENDLFNICNFLNCLTFEDVFVDVFVQLKRFEDVKQFNNNVLKVGLVDDFLIVESVTASNKYKISNIKGVLFTFKENS